MARKPTFGTPGTSKAYIFPDKRRLRGLIGAVGIAAVVVLFATDTFTRRKPFQTAGPLSKAHAIAGSECSKCHQAWHRPPDALCIGCHDPLPSVSRFGAVAHAERTKSGKRQPDREPRCVACHTEHEGLSTPKVAAGDEACSRCHGFRSFGSSHPEFRPLREAFAENPGVKFNHKRHLRELAGEKRGAPVDPNETVEPGVLAENCAACHKAALAGDDFVTISFDADCARCHYDKNGTVGSTDPVSAEAVATPEQLMQARPAPEWILAYKDDFEERRGRLTKKVLHHRDAWILLNLRLLSAALQGSQAPAAGESTAVAGNAAEIDARRAELSELDRQIELVHGKKSTSKLQARLAQIRAQEARIVQEIQQLDRRILEAKPETRAPSPGIDPAALKPALDELDAAIASIAALPDDWARQESARLRAMRSQIEGGAGNVGPGWSSYNLDRRKARLSDLLKPLGAAAPPAVRELSSLESPVSGETAPALTADQRGAAIREIDAALAALSASGESRVRDEIKNLRAKRERLATTVGGTDGGWSASELAKRKESAASRIEDLSRVAAAGEAVASMRRDLESVAAGGGRSGSEIASLRPEKERKAHALADLKREEATIEASLASGPADDGRIAALRQRKSQVENEIAALEQLASGAAAAAAAAAGSADPDEIRSTAERLVKPCMKCHVEAGLGLQPTSPARDVLGMSTFTHEPHLKQAACMDCHSGILESEKAEEVHFAGVDKCRDCHRWGGTEAACRTCHAYHPGPAAPAAPVVASLPAPGASTEGAR